MSAKPPKRRLPVYVQYISIRVCRYNPSFRGFSFLPIHDRNGLVEKLAKRKRRKVDISLDDLVLPPKRNKRKRSK